MKFIEQKRLELIRRLDAAYSVGGKQALAEMRSGEVMMLAAEKQLELSLVSRKLNQHPHDEVGMLRKGKLERELMDIHGFMDAKKKDKDGPEMDMG